MHGRSDTKNPCVDLPLRFLQMIMVGSPGRRLSQEIAVSSPVMFELVGGSESLPVSDVDQAIMRSNMEIILTHLDCGQTGNRQWRICGLWLGGEW